MLDQSMIKVGSVIKVNDRPFIIFEASRNKTAMRKAYLITRMKDLIDGSVLEKTFTQGEKAEEADLERGTGQYLYKDADNANFMDNKTYEQFSLPISSVAEQLQFMKEDSEIDILYFESKPVSVKPPVKVTLKIVEAPPAVRGNSAGAITKKAVLETGAEISVPIFLESGEDIIINTETGMYVERAK